MSVREYLPKDRNGRLFRVIEECGEVLQVLGKAGRFGMGSRQPNGGPRNVSAILAELRDLRDAIDALEPDLREELAGYGEDAREDAWLVDRGVIPAWASEFSPIRTQEQTDE